MMSDSKIVISITVFHPVALILMRKLSLIKLFPFSAQQGKCRHMTEKNHSGTHRLIFKAHSIEDHLKIRHELSHSQLLRACDDCGECNIIPEKQQLAP